MRYPVYPSQPNSGNVPPPGAFGPPDLYPTSSTAPYFRGPLDSMYGRHLAGAEVEKRMGEDAEPAYALNELKLMEELDDSAGNGVFDAPGTRPNNYPDAGVFASSFAFPGYLARERFWEKSEIIDGTTGRPVIYVPGGAVSMDSAAQVAFIESNRFKPPTPFIDQYGEEPVPDESTVNIMQHAIPVTQNSVGEFSTGQKLALTLAIAGVAVGAAYALTRKPARTPNKRRRRR
jgi:hypothetical protein